MDQQIGKNADVEASGRTELPFSKDLFPAVDAPRSTGPRDTYVDAETAFTELSHALTRLAALYFGKRHDVVVVGSKEGAVFMLNAVREILPRRWAQLASASQVRDHRTHNQGDSSTSDDNRVVVDQIYLPERYLNVSSFGGSRGGEVTFTGKVDVNGKHVILVDEIMDSGRTPEALLNQFRKDGAITATTFVYGVLDNPDQITLTPNSNGWPSLMYVRLLPHVELAGLGNDVDTRRHHFRWIPELFDPTSMFNVESDLAGVRETSPNTSPVYFTYPWTLFDHVRPEAMDITYGAELVPIWRQACAYYIGLEQVLACGLVEPKVDNPRSITRGR